MKDCKIGSVRNKGMNCAYELMKLIANYQPDPFEVNEQRLLIWENNNESNITAK